MSNYYADLNPTFGAKDQLRYTIFYRNQKGRIVNLGETDRRKYQFSTRKGAENTAAKFNALPGK